MDFQSSAPPLQSEINTQRRYAHVTPSQPCRFALPDNRLMSVITFRVQDDGQGGTTYAYALLDSKGRYLTDSVYCELFGDSAMYGSVHTVGASGDVAYLEVSSASSSSIYVTITQEVVIK